MSSPTATLDPRPVAALDAYPVMRYPTRAYQPDRASTPPARSPDQPSQTAKAPQNGAFAACRLDKPHHISAGDLHGARLSDHGDLDLAGVLQGVLDLAGDLVAQQRGGVVVDLLRLDHHPDLAAGLHGVAT